MKKILLGLGLVGVLGFNLSANEIMTTPLKNDLGVKIITDNFNTVRLNINVASNLTTYGDILNKSDFYIRTTDFHSIGLGVDNKLLIGTNNFKYGVLFEKYNTNKDMESELRIYGTYITNSYNIINKDVNFYVGAEYTYEHNNLKSQDYYISYLYGMIINKDLSIGIRAADTDNGINNILIASYKF